MTWLTWLSLAVVIAAVAALFGIQPKGTRPIANTRLMAVGRFVLLVVAVIFGYLAFRARWGG
jgi:hypothetical protein